MLAPVSRIRRFLEHDVWRINTAALKRPAFIGVQLLRLLLVVWDEFAHGQLTLRAMSLVYTTLLSLVPLLAVSFSVLKAFGVYGQLAPLLHRVLAPLGPMGNEAATRILGFVNNVQVGVLGSLGLAFLIYTVISLIQKVERSFNYVWHVESPRSLSRRFSDYLSVILVGPVLVFSALGLSASIMSNTIVQEVVAIEPFGTAMVAIGRVMPYLIIVGAFTFFYIFVPNTRVRFLSALIGGAVGGVAWQATGLAFAHFVAGSTRYAAIYSSLAILILFMIWLYLSWFILLLGAQIAYFHQNPEQIRPNVPLRLSNRLKERLGLAVMYLVAQTYRERGAECTVEQLSRRLGVPGDLLARVIESLLRAELLIEVPDGRNTYLPARDPAVIPVRELLQRLRRIEEEDYVVDEARLAIAPVDRTLKQVDEAGIQGLRELSLSDLLERPTE